MIWKILSLFLLQKMRDHDGKRTLDVWPSNHSYFNKAISTSVNHKLNKPPQLENCQFELKENETRRNKGRHWT